MTRRPVVRQIDCAGPEGNVYNIAAIFQSWNKQLKRSNVSIFDATTKRLGSVGDYNDVLDTFDEWMKPGISYEFLNDPRKT